MKFLPWQGRAAIVFLLFSIAFNLAHYAVFRDPDYIFKFILAQLGFLPISVFLVTVVINALLGRREKQAMLKKLNMVIGSFYSEVGTELLRLFSKRADGAAAPGPVLLNADWSDAEYARAGESLKGMEQAIRAADVDWVKVRSFLTAEKRFLLTLLGNPNLLEHESFTGLLWAVFHLAEELEHRTDVRSLREADSDHLVGDVQRVYVLLGQEWLAYMKHLQENYPYLFSLAVRTNPFNPDARAEVC